MDPAILSNAGRSVMDNLSPEHRKKNMSRIRSKGNRSTERKLRSSLVGAGISGFQLHPHSIPGKPDFVFPAHKLAVFVDGCFWHGCPDCYIRPQTSQAYWDEKLSRNRKRDASVNKELRAAGWTVLRFWEHQLKRPKKIRRMITRRLNLTK